MKKKILDRLMLIIVFIIITTSSITGIETLNIKHIQKIYTIEEFNKISRGTVYFGKSACQVVRHFTFY